MALRGIMGIERMERRSPLRRALLFLPRLLTFGLKLCLPAAVLIYAFTRPERVKVEPPRLTIVPDARTYEEIIPKIDVYKDAGADVPADIQMEVLADIPTIDLIDIVPEVTIIPDAPAVQDVRRDGPRHKPDTSHPQPDASQSQPDVSHQQPEIALPPI